MAITFENIETGDKISISRRESGKYYRAKLQALINSSNIGPNSDRGQDYGWRLDPEQQAQIEIFRENPETIEKTSQLTKVPVDSLTDAEFLDYLLHLQELGQSESNLSRQARQKAEEDYRQRVKAAHAQNAADDGKPAVDAGAEDEKPKTTRRRNTTKKSDTPAEG